MKSRGLKILAIDMFDTNRFANNFLSIDPHRIIAVDKVDNMYNSFHKMPDLYHVKADFVPLDSLVRANDAAHCMLQVMKRICKEK